MGPGPDGDAEARCAYLGYGARLEGFTLTNGNPYYSGGAVFCEPSAVVSNCTISGNSAGEGGGTYGGTIQNCTIYGNRADDDGGGTYESTVQNCTIYANKVGRSNLNWGNGGGTYDGTIENSIVYFNVNWIGLPNNCRTGTVSFTCTTPDPGGIGNTTDNPQFVDMVGLDFRLQPTSPCVNTGTNQTWMVGGRDLNGLPRILDGTVDMGCYEALIGIPDFDEDGINDVWEFEYFPNLITMSYHSDSDLDGSCDGDEFHAGTLPTDSSSYLGIKSVALDAEGGQAIIRWSSVSNKLYSLSGSSNLVHGMDTLLDEQIPATPPRGTRWAVYPGLGVDSFGIQSLDFAFG